MGLLRSDCGFDERRTPLRTYLFGAVRNQASKRFRRREDAGGGARDAARFAVPESEKRCARKWKIAWRERCSGCRKRSARF